MKSVSVARSATALMLAAVVLLLTGCGYRPYKTTENQFAGRPVPPSKLTQRVMVAISQASALGGALEILDAKRDIRSNVYTPNSTFMISAFSANGLQIQSYPEQTRGFVYSGDGSLTTINYSTEAGAGTTITSPSSSLSSVYVPEDTQAAYTAVERTGSFYILAPSSGSATSSSISTNYTFALPSVYKVISNPSHTVVLLLTRNTNMVYRLLLLNSNQTTPPGAVTCQPVNKPVYCILPVGASQPDGSISEPTFHRPYDAYFSPDGSQVYVLNCGAECGGTDADAASSVSFADLNSLRIDYYPPSSTYVSPVSSSVSVPGGATDAISDGTTLYVAGQSLHQPDKLFTGNLSLIPLSTKTVSQTFPISDGTHTKMLFADNNTLWIGSSNCASGERAATKQNYNCLTRYDITNKAAAIVPAVNPSDANSKVPYPNENLDQYYYGSLTGLCWVEDLNKVYTAYGGQVHAFNTADGSEIDNTNITVQGTANDVAYIDATTNLAN